MIEDRFKFRAWCTIDNPGKMEYYEWGLEANPHQKRIAVARFSDALDNPDLYTVLACTGLKDSTKWEELTLEEQEAWCRHSTSAEWEGRLIYEGDVVEFLGGARGVIVWGEDDCVACFTVEYEEGGEKFRDYDYLEDKGLKVLGNIYESPSLLEAER